MNETSAASSHFAGFAVAESNVNCAAGAPGSKNAIGNACDVEALPEGSANEIDDSVAAAELHDVSTAVVLVASATSSIFPREPPATRERIVEKGRATGS